MPKLPDKKTNLPERTKILIKLLSKFCNRLKRFMTSQLQSYDQV